MLTNKTLAAALAVAMIAGAALLSPTAASAGDFGHRFYRSDFGYGHKYGFGYKFGRPSYRFCYGFHRYGGWR